MSLEARIRAEQVKKDFLMNLIIESFETPYETGRIQVFQEPDVYHWLINRDYKEYEMRWIIVTGEMYAHKYFPKRNRWDVKKIR